jgi:integrase
VLVAVLVGTGMRIGEAAGLNVEDVYIHSQVVHVRRGIWKGQDLAPKTENAIREVDIDEMLTEMLRIFIGERNAGRLFLRRTGTPLATATSASACSTRCSNGWDSESSAARVQAFTRDAAWQSRNAAGPAEAVDWPQLA